MKDKFKYIVIAVVLLIPFIYSYFYLKAYWNPYGEGNIDNLPVAIVNKDKGDKGTKLIKSIINSKKLKIKQLDEEKANEGLNKGEYYAIISIPDNFTKDMESAKEEEKHHATITYSPNQKTNYLASQIINSVVNAVEKNLDNEINSQIVGSLSENVEEVPNKLDKISNGFSELKKGTAKLSDGSNTLLQGTNTLESNYRRFNSGVSEIKNGSDKLSSAINSLDNGINQIENSNAKIDELISGITALKQGSDGFTYSLQNYTNGVKDALNNSKPIIDDLKNQACTAYTSGLEEYKEKCTNLTILSETYNVLINSSDQLVNGNNQINSGITALKEKENDFRTLQNGLSSLKEGSAQIRIGAETLKGGAASLYNSSSQIENALVKVNTGTSTLNNGLLSLDSSVYNAKEEIDTNIESTKSEIKKVETLKDYSKAPVKINTKEVNKVSSYGTAFSPLFLSIGLWIGCLMMFMVFYYDKEERFGVLGINSKNKVKQLLAYHGLITLSSIVLGFLSQIMLDLQISNIFLYYLSLIIIGNTFMSIMSFLITNLNDIGKFISLILLVLQLAASGGTFPVETVTKSFRWLHNLLPMTYSVNLLREVLVKIESNLFTNNIIALSLIFILLSMLNVGIIYKRQKSRD